jgi:hypothetical protein
MPKRKDDVDNIVTVRIRMSKELMERCNTARKAGVHKEDAESSFIRFLIELGLNRYVKTILALENSENENTVARDRVIPNEPAEAIGLTLNKTEKKVSGG